MITHQAKHLLFCIAVAFQAFGFLQKAHAQNQPTLKRIFEIWKRRQEQTHTFDFQWKEERVYAKGSMFVFNGEAQPSTDVVQTNQLSLQVDGDRMRLWSNAPPWNPQSGVFVPRDRVSVFDGEDEKVFYDQADPTVQATALNKVGFIGIHQFNQDVVDYNLWPILLTYRPFHRDMGRLNHNEWGMTGERGVIAGRDCFILRKTSHPITERCWVDFERDCTIVRFEYVTNYRFQVDIVYRDTDGLGWIPAKWKTVEHLPKGTLKESCQSEVTGYTINKELPENWFHFEFPVGTEVKDNKKKIEYIVREGGGKRLITEQERVRGATYEQLLATESGQGGLPSSGRMSWSFFLLFGIILMISLIFIMRKRIYNRT